MNETNFTVYLAPKNFTYELINELTINPFEVRGQLVLVKGNYQKLSWSQNTWFNPIFIPITSINDAVKKLTKIQRNWCLHSEQNHRRAILIQDKLPHVSAKKIYFGKPYPKARLGSWTLWEPDLILASHQCSSIFPNGIISFHENKLDPPSRAYLKLWEIFTLFSIMPKPKEICLDLGSAPGGWTWVLSKIGTRVLSIDKAKLANHLCSLQNIEYYQGSGFACTPEAIGPVDWIFSDMICYPEKLYSFIKRWIDSRHCHTIICSIKLQNNTDQKILSYFKELPLSKLIHLTYNKHELTFIYSNKYPLFPYDEKELQA